MMQELGYLHSSNWTSYNGGSTRAADSLLGIKYIIDGPTGITNRGSRLVTQGLKKLKQIGGYTIYENPRAQQVGVVAPTKTTTAATGWAYRSMANVYNVASVYNDLTGVKGLYLTRGGVKETGRDLKKRTVSFTIPGGGLNHALYLQLRADKLYSMLPESDPDVDVYMNGQKIVTVGTENENGVIPIGAWPEGQILHVTLKVQRLSTIDTKMLGMRITHLPKYFVNVEYQEKVDQALNTLDSQPVNLKRLSTTHWRGLVTASKPKQSVIMTLPYDTGWTIKVDGKKVKQHKYLELMKFNLDTAGQHRIEMKYTFPQLRQGLKVSLMATCGLIGLLIIQAFSVWGWRIRNRRLERVAAANAPLFDPHYFDYH